MIRITKGSFTAEHKTFAAALRDADLYTGSINAEKATKRLEAAGFTVEETSETGGKEEGKQQDFFGQTGEGQRSGEGQEVESETEQGAQGDQQEQEGKEEKGKEQQGQKDGNGQQNEEQNETESETEKEEQKETKQDNEMQQQDNDQQQQEEQIPEFLKPFLRAIEKNITAKMAEEAETAKSVDQETVNNLINEALKNYDFKGSGKEITIKKIDGSKTKIGKQHKEFEKLLANAACRNHTMLVGPAGTGKSHACHSVAKALELEFRYNAISGQSTMAQFFGYQDANGRYVTTAFREAYEKGGVYLLDEFDAGNSNILTSLNNAIAAGLASFPDGMIEMHENFICLAAANTYGTGATAEYNGRNRLDVATLDRFAVLEWGYDEELEMDLAANKEWCKFIHTVRRAVSELQGIRAVMSFRAVKMGEKLLAYGLKKPDVMKMIVFKGMSEKDVRMIQEKVKSFEKAAA